eukprot:scaffold23861_cov110-Isochrysis_galbana.AAC.3
MAADGYLQSPQLAVARSTEHDPAKDGGGDGCKPAPYCVVLELQTRREALRKQLTPLRRDEDRVSREMGRHLNACWRNSCGISRANGCAGAGRGGSGAGWSGRGPATFPPWVSWCTVHSLSHCLSFQPGRGTGALPTSFLPPKVVGGAQGGHHICSTPATARSSSIRLMQCTPRKPTLLVRFPDGDRTGTDYSSVDCIGMNMFYFLRCLRGGLGTREEETGGIGSLWIAPGNYKAASHVLFL